jgi:hypothetical protein
VWMSSVASLVAKTCRQKCNSSKLLQPSTSHDSLPVSIAQRGRFWVVRLATLA